jgi:hypothetical protein
MLHEYIAVKQLSGPTIYHTALLKSTKYLIYDVLRLSVKSLHTPQYTGCV